MEYNKEIINIAPAPFEVSVEDKLLKEICESEHQLADYIDAIMILMTQHYNHNKDENYTENYFVMTALRSVSYIIRHL
jgi:hypothetical protein